MGAAVKPILVTRTSTPCRSLSDPPSFPHQGSISYILCCDSQPFYWKSLSSTCLISSLSLEAICGWDVCPPPQMICHNYQHRGSLVDVSSAITCGVDEDINHRAKLVPILQQSALYFRFEYLNVLSFPFYQQPGAVVLTVWFQHHQQQDLSVYYKCQLWF